VPGNITSPKSFGPHVLIRQGAKLVTSWEDVVEELSHPIREKILAPLVAAMQAQPEPQLDDAEKKVWGVLTLHDSTPIDSLLAKLPLSTSEVYSALLTMETRDLIRQLPGNKYIRRL
jgi:DNA processing protein